jgi:hypothetical protein
MLEYYGGVCASELNENCTHAIATSYNANIFDNLKSRTNDNIIIVTPDWIIDSIDKNCLVDNSIYNPKYLITNTENENLINRNRAAVEEEDESLKTPLSSITIEQTEQQNKSKNRNYVIGTENFFNQNSTQNEIINHHQINNKILENKSSDNQLPQTPNSKLNTKPKKSRGATRLNSSTQQPSIQQNQTPNKNSKTGTCQANTTSSSSFNFDMNEIFQSVIGEAMNNSMSKPKPILLELIENKKDVDSSDVNSSLFSLYNETYYTQENSHLIKFNNCLVGCLFYLKTFEDYYSNETLNEWTKMIESYGGRVVDDYNANIDQITHVLCPNRNSNIYKTAFKDEKRIVTQFWLEDVLEEEKMKPPWKSYHFPSLFERNNGPLKNHVI